MLFYNSWGIVQFLWHFDNLEDVSLHAKNIHSQQFEEKSKKKKLHSRN